MKINIKPYPKKGIRRKIKVQIDKYDTYSMDNSLAKIIYPMLIQLKDTKQGVPGEFADVGGEDYDSQNSFDFYTETHRDAFDEKVKEWDEILDKMIWSFQQIAEEDWESQYHHGEPKWDWVETDEMINPVTQKKEKMYQMVDKNPTEHWVDFKGMKLHQEKIQEGINLFAKYYFNLWD